jgi:hypothetical protein
VVEAVEALQVAAAVAEAVAAAEEVADERFSHLQNHFPDEN